MPATYPVHWRRGVHLPSADVWLDPTERRQLAVVSHAHADHVAAHQAVVCTAATYRILSHRLGPRSRATPLRFGEELRLGDAVVSLHSAGHVLGSSQVLVRDRGLRILYSGDVRLRPSCTAEPLEHVACDLLIVEATFGHPHYRFPPRSQVVDRIVHFCEAALAEGRIPVLLAYALGKGQELLAALRGSGLRLLLHESIHAIAQLYRELGADLPAAARLADDGSGAEGCVVVLPPHLRAAPGLPGLERARVALLSGWAVDGGAARRLGCHSAFPLSDHADFDELLEYVERSGARRVLTLHGFDAELAAQLRRRGVDASPLAVPEQLGLALA